MINTFSQFGLNITNSQKNAFEKYYELLIHFNKMFNITAITERDEVIKKHFIDSVLGVDNFLTGSLIDVGSGGGFPAIPIKIMRDDINLTLLEATGKKCEFLRTVVKELNLKNVTVINDRAEILAKNQDFRESFDMCSARAVARLSTLLEYCLPFVKKGGIFVAYKGDADQETVEAKNAIKVLGGRLKLKKDYLLEDAKRSIIIVEKIENTDKKYPRGNGKERKNPL